MHHAMRKPWYLPFKRFAAWITELNNYLPILPGSIAHKKIPPKELNKILLYYVPNSGEKQYYLHEWDVEGKSYKETCEMLKHTEIAEQAYKGGTPSKTTTRAYAKNFSHGRKCKGGKSASPTNPEKVRAGKCKKTTQDTIWIGQPVIKHAWFMDPDTLCNSVKLWN